MKNEKKFGAQSWLNAQFNSHGNIALVALHIGVKMECARLCYLFRHAPRCHRNLSCSIETEGARAGDPISFSQLTYPYNPHQQGYGSAGSSTPPPSSASAASSVSPPPPAVNEREEGGREGTEKGERDGSPVPNGLHMRSATGSRDASVASCSTVNEIVNRDTKASPMVQERAFTTTNRDYSFLNQQTIRQGLFSPFEFGNSRAG